MDMNFILASIGVFLVTILVLVVILLVAKKFLVASGNVKLTINGENQLEVESGSTLLNTLAVNGVFLPSACVVRVLADSVNVRLLKVVVKYCLLK